MTEQELLNTHSAILFDLQEGELFLHDNHLYRFVELGDCGRATVQYCGWIANGVITIVARPCLDNFNPYAAIYPIVLRAEFSHVNS